jgi:hypothetical protein
MVHGGSGSDHDILLKYIYNMRYLGRYFCLEYPFEIKKSNFKEKVDGTR